MRAETRAAGVAILATAGMLAAGAFEPLERAALDLWFSLRGPRAVQAPVAIVAIDEASLARYGQMPWDRHRFAELLAKLSSARVVAFDIAFNEPGRSAPGEDEALAQGLGKVPASVLPVFRAFASAQEPVPQLFLPLPELSKSATALGVAHFSTQHQGVILEIEPYQRQGGEVVPALSTATARAFLGGAGLTLPGDTLFRSGTLTLDFPGPKPSIPTFSAEDVLAGRIPSERFAGQAVLIGATATGLPDTNFAAPSLVRGPISGVELHAIATENLLAGKGLKRPQPWLMMLAIALLGLSVGRLLLRPDPSPVRRRLAILAGSALGVLALAFGLFRFAGVWWDVVPALALLAGCFIGGNLWQQSALLRSRNRMLEWYAAELQREAKRQREQIDGELHDEAQQLLIVLGRDLKRVRKLADLSAVRQKVANAEELNQRILDEILRLRKNLVPHTLGKFGLKAAIAEMAGDLSARGDVSVTCEVSHWPATVDPVLESELYWLVKEALNNARKHAQAQTIRVGMDVLAGRLLLEIRDDGKGFEPPAYWEPPQGHQHSGLHRMWVRAQALKGELTVQSSPGQGTNLRITVPFIPAPERSHGHVEASRSGR
jgi:CHASE2 domain-containing sensor protein/anti-sigma regulatory factor (Ser/Thr protein kinase)